MVNTFDIIIRFYGAAFYRNGTKTAVYEVTTPTQGSLIINGNFVHEEGRSVHDLLFDHGISLAGWSSTPVLPEKV